MRFLSQITATTFHVLIFLIESLSIIMIPHGTGVIEDNSSIRPFNEICSLLIENRLQQGILSAFIVVECVIIPAQI